VAIVFLGFGSNLGDREGNIHAAITLLSASGVKVLKVASMIETSPVGGPPQGLFLNTAAKVETTLSPHDLLGLIHQVEATLGRVRSIPNAPRTIDVDILTYEDLRLNDPDLIIPHPRMLERDFVTRPMAELS